MEEKQNENNINLIIDKQDESDIKETKDIKEEEPKKDNEKEEEKRLMKLSL